jgi:hypothetical protein
MASCYPAVMGASPPEQEDLSRPTTSALVSPSIIDRVVCVRYALGRKWRIDRDVAVIEAHHRNQPIALLCNKSFVQARYQRFERAEGLAFANLIDYLGNRSRKGGASLPIGIVAEWPGTVDRAVSRDAPEKFRFSPRVALLYQANQQLVTTVRYYAGDYQYFSYELGTAGEIARIFRVIAGEDTPS